MGKIFSFKKRKKCFVSSIYLVFLLFVIWLSQSFIIDFVRPFLVSIDNMLTKLSHTICMPLQLVFWYIHEFHCLNWFEQSNSIIKLFGPIFGKSSTKTFLSRTVGNHSMNNKFFNQKTDFFVINNLSKLTISVIRVSNKSLIKIIIISFRWAHQCAELELITIYVENLYSMTVVILV